ncbi:MAG: hypothetical protein ACPHYE_05795, partial [Henriciella sp.]
MTSIIIDTENDRNLIQSNAPAMATPVRLSACSILRTETTLKAWYRETLNIIYRRAPSDPTGLEQDKISDTR